MTTTAPRCELTDLYVTDCAHCRGIELPPELHIAGYGRAHRPGTCADCGDTFDTGARIAITAAGTRLHEECA